MIKYLTILIALLTIIAACDDALPTPSLTKQGDFLDSVVIKDWVWSVKNLDVEYFRNGDKIPQVTDAQQWHNLKTPAWCYYDNNPQYNDVYGKLYNWYAVADPRGLAPEGWHIPDTLEWGNFLRSIDSLKSGIKLKEKGTEHWFDPNTGASDAYGFCGLPGGVRNQFGEFELIGMYGKMWTSQEHSPFIGMGFFLHFKNEAVILTNSEKNSGFSVRLVKD